MPISWPRSALWQALLVLAVFFVGFITLSKTASGCFIPRDGRIDPNNPYCWTPTPIPAPTPTASPSFCPGAISWHEASQHVGTLKSVKGLVVDRYWPSVRTSQPTLLFLGQPFANPTQEFTVHLKFASDHFQYYRGRTICVTGRIGPFAGMELAPERMEAAIQTMLKSREWTGLTRQRIEGWPSIDVTSPSQIVIYSSVTQPPVTRPPTPPPIPIPIPTAPPSFCPGAISWHEASQYVGTLKSVKGPVTSIYRNSIYWNKILDLGQPYPNHTFSVVITGEGTGVGAIGQFICVTGLIERNTGWTQTAHLIEATAASQIVIYSPVSQPPITQPPLPMKPDPEPSPLATGPASNDPWGEAIPIIIGTLVWLLCFAGLIVFVRRR